MDFGIFIFIFGKEKSELEMGEINQSWRREKEMRKDENSQDCENVQQSRVLGSLNIKRPYVVQDFKSIR